MAKVLTMPKLSDTMEEGGVANWLKTEGEKIKSGESLVEIETDKATMEYPSPESGFILKFLVSPGSAVPIGAPLLILGNAKDESFDLDALLKSQSKSLTHPPKDAETKSHTAVLPSSPAATTHGVLSLSSPSAGVAQHGRILASPLAKKMAKEQNIALDAIRGSGPSGRIIARDIDVAMNQGSSSLQVAGANLSLAGIPKDQEIPLSLMRKTIAKRLTSAKNEAPHFYLKRRVDMTAALALKSELSISLSEKVSINDILIFAVSRALRQHPKVNASWAENKIIQWGGVHVAVAVALDSGLVTPVIRNTDQIGLRAIAQIARLLAQKAKDEELKNEDYQGGTFTISNLGMLGIEEFTAIINPPQAAILAVGTVRKEPYVDDSGAVIVKDMMTMTMSCDHRVVDGAVGAKFLQTLVLFLEKPQLMLG